ncbi:hypothetical protein [Ruminococcus sp.]|uniref:hypothetical protein n=1 Tax=Ruminococcus sp. TaxID=41978 RepID=UPI001ECAE147|nr:hypothetical protein [Ruminococcus sp.]MBP1533306.1 hypothetical protein [Ruminococcus sp.]MBR1429802.1 hypothetical protein [Ruminococcus sp.]
MTRRIKTILIIAGLLTVVLFISFAIYQIKKESLVTSFRNIEFSENDTVKVATHTLNNGECIESSVRITKNPIANSNDYNIIVIFSNHEENDNYKIENLTIKINSQNSTKIKSIYYDDGKNSGISNDNINSKTDFRFESSSNYIYLNIVVTDYSEDSMGFDLNYDINGIGFYSINRFNGFNINMSC